MEFKFECTLCGDCCTGSQVVRLNGCDLDLLQEYLGLPDRRQLFEQGWVEARQDDQGRWRPVLRFKQKPLRFCRFLENRVEEDGRVLGLCRLHPRFKPLVCHLAPLAREVELPSGRETWQVTAPVDGCPGMGRGNAKFPQAEVVPLRDRLQAEVEWFRTNEAASDRLQTAGQAIDFWCSGDFGLDSKSDLLDN